MREELTILWGSQISPCSGMAIFRSYIRKFIFFIIQNSFILFTVDCQNDFFGLYTIELTMKIEKSQI